MLTVQHPALPSPAVSVVIPSYNCESFILETIASVQGQTFENIEIIVVDDGSTDRTRSLVASFGQSVRLIEQENLGVCAARNRGIREARGEYLCFLDHDDFWLPDKLIGQVEALRAHPEVGVAFAPFILWQPDTAGAYPEPSSLDAGNHQEGIDTDFSGWIYHQFLLDCWMLTSSAMFRREVFNHCGGFDENLPYSEDWDLWLRISQEYRFIKLRKPNTLYRQHRNQGNRLIRNFDYRSELLLSAVRKWGYCSKDGRCVTSKEFRRQLAEYVASFGFQHLQGNNIRVGIVALLRAWSLNPYKLKFWAYILAAMLGWKPRW